MKINSTESNFNILPICLAKYILVTPSNKEIFMSAAAWVYTQVIT